MLDTIILQFEPNQYHITNYGNFGTSKEQVEKTSSGFCKWHNNPTSRDKKLGVYKPRLTLIKRGFRKVLKIEFSAPKLLFGNNIDELEEKNYDEVVKKLQERLKDMGVLVWTKHIEEAEVLSFHPSKNIPLSGGYTASLAISELKKVGLNKRFDFDEKNFRNNGEVLQFYTRSHSFAIYDKINDLAKPQKRAVDKEQTKQQLTIFDYIKENKLHLELLRFEIRLSVKQKMNAVLTKINYPTNPIFRDIFKIDLCKKIVNLYWDDFFSENLFLFNTVNNPQDILQLVLMKNPKAKILNAIKVVGLLMLCKDDKGMSGFRQVVDKHRPKTNWDKVKRDLKMFRDDVFTNQTWGFVEDIHRELKDFKSFKLSKNENLLCKEK
jgi:hypothetical protein